MLRAADVLPSSRRGRRRRRLRRLDRPAPARAGVPRDPDRCLGSGERPRQLGRRDPDPPGDLRAGPDLRPVGGPLARSLARGRAALGRPSLPSDRSALAVRPRRQLRPAGSPPPARKPGSPSTEIGLDEARRRFPQIGFEGISSVFFEETAGYLMARRACRAVAEAAGGYPASRGLGIRGGAGVAHGRLRPGGRRLTSSPADPGSARLFPDVSATSARRARRSSSSAPRPGCATPEQLPVWIESGERFFYGIPGNDHRGFKVADDTRGEPFDPTSGERVAEPRRCWSGRGTSRAPLPRRWPARRCSSPASASTRTARTATSSSTATPGCRNVWIVGGGSGHGFKLGPAVGEHVAALVLGEAEPGVAVDEEVAGRTVFVLTDA